MSKFSILFQLPSGLWYINNSTLMDLDALLLIKHNAVHWLRWIVIECWTWWQPRGLLCGGRTETSACPADWIKSEWVKHAWPRDLVAAAPASGRFLVRCRPLANKPDASPHKVMSQFSPYMPCSPDLYPIHLLNNQNSKQHLAYTYIHE